MWFSSPEKNYNDLNAGDHRPVKEWKVIITRYDTKEVVHTEKLLSKYEPRKFDEPYNIVNRYVDDNNLFFSDYDWHVVEVK